jgi:hypothetical protein
VLVLGLALSSDAPTPSEAQSALYYPTKVGTKWLYSHPNYEQTSEIRSVEEKTEEKIVTVAFGTVFKAGQKQSNTEVIAVSSKGLFSKKIGPATVVPPLCRLKFPHNDGDTWEVNVLSQGLNMAEYKGVCTVRKAESVEVPAGKYMAIRVEFVGTSGGRPEKSTSWYAPNIGLVKKVVSEGKQRGELELKSFSLGK